MGLLDGGIAATVYAAMKDLFLDFTLIKDTKVADPNIPWEPVDSADTEYSCKAVVLEYSERELETENVQQGDRKILILANSISVQPAIGDRIKGASDSRQYEIVSPIKTDPARATYECQGR